MAVNRDDSAVVLYHDAVSVAVVPLRQDNRAGFRGEYRSAVGRHDVHAAVVVVSAVAVHHLAYLSAVGAAHRPDELTHGSVLRYRRGDSGGDLLGAQGDYLGNRLADGDAVDYLAARFNAVDVGYVRGHALDSLFALPRDGGGTLVVGGIVHIFGIVVRALVVGFPARYCDREERLLLGDEQLVAYLEEAVQGEVRIEPREFLLGHAQLCNYAQGGITLHHGVVRCNGLFCGYQPDYRVLADDTLGKVQTRLVGYLALECHGFVAALAVNVQQVVEGLLHAVLALKGAVEGVVDVHSVGEGYLRVHGGKQLVRHLVFGKRGAVAHHLHLVGAVE